MARLLDPVRHRPLGIAIAVVAVAIIARLTLAPSPGMEDIVSAMPITCLVCGDLGGVDVTLNVLLFMPLGFGLRLTGMRLSRAVLVGSLLSLSIETTQYAFLAGRDASVSDWLTNSTGTLLGALIAGAIGTLLFPDARARRRLVVAADAALLAFIGGTLWALQPSLPRTTWWGQWQADLPQFETFRGRVLTIDLDGRVLPHYRIAASAETRARMLGGRTALTARAVVAQPTSGLAPLASVFDERQQKITLLGQAQRSLIYELRTHADDARLRGVGVRLDDAFPARAGDTVVVAGRFDHQRVELSASGPAGRRAFAYTPNAATGWALFLPYRHPLGREAPLLDVLWIGVLLLPLGYWGWNGARPLRAVLAAVALPALGLLLLPPVFGFPALPSGTWIGVAAGLRLGAGLARLLRGRTDDGLRVRRSPSEPAGDAADQRA